MCVTVVDAGGSTNYTAGPDGLGVANVFFNIANINYSNSPTSIDVTFIEGTCV